MLLHHRFKNNNKKNTHTHIHTKRQKKTKTKKQKREGENLQEWKTIVYTKSKGIISKYYVL